MVNLKKEPKIRTPRTVKKSNSSKIVRINKIKLIK